MLFMGIGFVGGDFTLAVATEPANVVLMQIIRRDSLIIAIIILGNDTRNLCKPVHNACVSKYLKIGIIHKIRNDELHTRSKIICGLDIQIPLGSDRTGIAGESR